LFPVGALDFAPSSAFRPLHRVAGSKRFGPLNLFSQALSRSLRQIAYLQDVLRPFVRPSTDYYYGHQRQVEVDLSTEKE